MSYNKIILIGRLTDAPELKFTPSGIPVMRFTLAVNRAFNNSQGERETDFIDVVVWRALAETCASHLKKGYMVAVDGRLQIRSYEDNHGVRRKAAEVVADTVRFLDRGKDGRGSPGQQNDGYGEDAPFTEDDLPF